MSRFALSLSRSVSFVESRKSSPSIDIKRFDSALTASELAGVTETVSDVRFPYGEGEMKKFWLVIIVLGSGLVMTGISGCSGSTPATSLPTSSTPLQTIQALQAAGKLPVLDVTSSLTGTDSDNNGVRDDLDTYIGGRTDTAIQKKALTQLAAAIQTTLTVDTTSASALAAVSLALNRADTCIWQQYKGNHPTLQANTMEELSINTQTRLIAYEKYNAARNGAAIVSISGTTCN